MLSMLSFAQHFKHAEYSDCKLTTCLRPEENFNDAPAPKKARTQVDEQQVAEFPAHQIIVCTIEYFKAQLSVSAVAMYKCVSLYHLLWSGSCKQVRTTVGPGSLCSMCSCFESDTCSVVHFACNQSKRALFLNCRYKTGRAHQQLVQPKTGSNMQHSHESQR